MKIYNYFQHFELEYIDLLLSRITVASYGKNAFLNFFTSRFNSNPVLMKSSVGRVFEVAKASLIIQLLQKSKVLEAVRVKLWILIIERRFVRIIENLLRSPLISRLLREVWV